MVDHVIVIGLGSVVHLSFRVSSPEDRRVVVIERDANNRYLAQARALGVPVVIAGRDAAPDSPHG